MESLKQKTARGLLWGSLNTGIQQILNLVFGIILARWLTKEDYGMVGMLMVFSALAGTLQEGGFISALNKRKDVSREDYNSVFWFNVVMGGLLYALLFFSAPLIADFYNEPELTPLARFVFLGFFISAFNISPRAVLFRELMVRETTIMGFAALVISGLVGICMVFMGYSYWGLATQGVVYALVITLMSYYYSHFRPMLHFSSKPIREMFGFSGKLIVTYIFNILNQQLMNVILGYCYTKTEVGTFTQANKWNTMGHQFVTNMISGVAQPVFTKVEETRVRQQAVLRKMLRFTAMVSFPLMFGLAIVSREFIIITITEKWLASADMLSLLCVWGAFVPIITLLSNYVISRGKSNIYMWVTMVLCLMQVSVAYLMYPFGLSNMLTAFVVVNIAWLFVWFYFVQRENGLSLFVFLRDLSPYFLLSLALAALTWWTCSGISLLWGALLLKIAMMGSIYCLTLYVSGSVIFKEGLTYIFKKKIS
ncbi:MAG: lipopolysaccharide biosynthesis protein [Bacteroidaceae bacterium]|nr:lipopolysaccharide biosynthesis protein [Bacteroidaceae bacterium]